MSLRHLRAIVRKEVQHIMRDRATLILVLVTPTAMLFLMAFALAVDIKHVPIAVLDYDRTPTSRSLIRRVTEGNDLDLYTEVGSLDEVNRLLVGGDVKAAMVIGAAFEDDLMSLRGMPLQVVIDGTEPKTGGFVVERVGGQAEAFVGEVLARQIQVHGVSLDSLQPIDLRVRALYNPALKPRVDMVPGLISMVLGFPALSVALTLAHEREHGTLEQVLVTPVGRVEFLLGKMIPYVIVGLVNVIVIPMVARATFHIPFNGSFPLFFLLSALFLFAILGVGMVVGVFTRTQPAALALSFLVIFFPGFFLTGIFFPIVSMPEVMRVESLGMPGTHYAVITRGLFLTGVGLDVLWPYAIMLVGLCVGFTAIAVFFFRKKLG
ncbi:MAG: ABC transporter permease [Anaerolineae bacterium]|nr:ABC transporter permease [Anaerolineae bacterium]